MSVSKPTAIEKVMNVMLDLHFRPSGLLPEDLNMFMYIGTVVTSHRVSQSHRVNGSFGPSGSSSDL